MLKMTSVKLVTENDYPSKLLSDLETNVTGVHLIQNGEVWMFHFSLNHMENGT